MYQVCSAQYAVYIALSTLWVPVSPLHTNLTAAAVLVVLGMPKLSTFAYIRCSSNGSNVRKTKIEYRRDFKSVRQETSVTA